MTEFLQRDFAHQNFFDLCIHEKQRLRQALNPLSNLLLTKILLCWDRPNITGAFSNSYRGIVGETQGAFTNDYWYRFRDWGATGSVDNYDGAAFDASRSNQLFGQSQSVQPSALMFLPAIKS